MSEENQSQESGPEIEGLILTQAKEPFKDIQGASNKRIKLMAENPGTEYSVMPYKGGYALVKTVKTPEEKRTSKKDVEEKETGYRRVRFHAKSNPADTEDVFLSVNGAALLLQREVETIVPTNYLEVADNTLQQRFRQMPGETRKVLAQVKTFPYENLGPATKEEFEKMKRSGTDKLNASVNA